MPSQLKTESILESNPAIPVKLVLHNMVPSNGLYWYEDYASLECEWTELVSSYAALRFKSDPGSIVQLGCLGRLYRENRHVPCYVTSISTDRLTVIVDFV
jgi:hypothetical protein